MLLLTHLLWPNYAIQTGKINEDGKGDDECTVIYIFERRKLRRKIEIFNEDNRNWERQAPFDNWKKWSSVSQNVREYSYIPQGVN